MKENKLKSLGEALLRAQLANFALIAVGLLWVIGVDSLPFMKVIGAPLFVCAVVYWMKHSSIAKKIIGIMDDGLSGKFNEE